MKIIAINGSPRTIRSTTRKLAGFVLKGAAEAGALFLALAPPVTAQEIKEATERMARFVKRLKGLSSSST